MIAASVLSQADIIKADALQVGGFLEGGLTDNSLGHQNYFVGYGSVGGFRSPERRSFLWYHIPSFEGTIVDVSIKFKMVAATSLIFGYDPGSPTGHDAVEKFQLGATTVDHGTMTRLDLSTSEAETIFEGMDDHPIAPANEFSMSTTYDFPFTVDVHLDSLGKSIVSSKRGLDLVLTGWMPTWTENDELDASRHLIEGDELLFGLSDVPHLAPEPEMTIAFTSVPEPGSVAALAIGMSFLIRRRSRR